MVDRFVKKGVDINSYTDVFPPLTIAARNGYLEIVQALIRASADPNHPVSHSNIVVVQCSRCRKTSAFDGTSGFEFKCPSCQNVTKLEASLEIDQHGICSLHAACMMKGNAEVTKILLEAGADPTTKTAKGRTPLMYAANGGFVECAKLLLMARADVNAIEGRDGDTALHMAVRNGHSETVELLVAAGASLKVQNNVECTPMDVAEKSKRSNLVSLLSADNKPRKKAAQKDAKSDSDAVQVDQAASTIQDQTAIQASASSLPIDFESLNMDPKAKIAGLW